jgi:hypothetical protein
MGQMRTPMRFLRQAVGLPLAAAGERRGGQSRAANPRNPGRIGLDWARRDSVNTTVATVSCRLMASCVTAITVNLFGLCERCEARVFLRPRPGGGGWQGFWKVSWSRDR